MAKVFSGQINVTTAGTAVAGPSTPVFPWPVEWYLTANDGNTGAVYVGNDGNDDVTAVNGYPLNAGESIKVSVDKLSRLYFDGDTNGNDVQWFCTHLPALARG